MMTTDGTSPDDGWSRRRFLGTSVAAGAVALGVAGAATGCATTGAAGDPWRPGEASLVRAPRDDFDLVLREGDGIAALRAWARPAPAGVDLAEVAARMERTMQAAGGVGLAAPQVGLGLRVAVVLHGWRREHPRVVFVRNPEILERSDETIEFYEACLSIPGVGGLVRRNRWIRVRHEAPDGAPLVTEAEGADAVLWQHEIDHLDGVLYPDRVLGELLPIEEMRRRREERERQEGPVTGVRRSDGGVALL